MAKILSCPIQMFPAKVEQGETLPFCLSSPIVNNCDFCGLCSAKYSLFLCCLLMISLFEMALKQHAEVRSSVPKCKKTVICSTEKIHVLDKHRSGMS